MTRRYVRVLTVVLIVTFSFGLRVYAANQLSVDYDEPVYLAASLRYTNYLREAKFSMLARDETNFEHPALHKIMYGVVLLSQPPLSKLYDKDLVPLDPISSASANDWVLAGRYLSVVISTIAIAILAAIQPLAGLFLGMNTLNVNYTSEFYLEALPLWSSLLCAVCYSRWFEKARRGSAPPGKAQYWLVASAVFLGITAASKYVYCIVGLAIAGHFLIACLKKQIRRHLFFWLIGWVLLAWLMFFLFDPYLWPDPIQRLIKSVSFHLNYQGSDFVRSYQYPFWQPLVWLSNYLTNYGLRPVDAFPVNIDPLIFGLALIGLPRLYKRQLVFFMWLAFGLATLLIWNTKWPQYTMIVLVPFAMAAGEGFTVFVEMLINSIKSKRNAPGAYHAKE